MVFRVWYKVSSNYIHEFIFLLCFPDKTIGKSGDKLQICECAAEFPPDAVDDGTKICITYRLPSACLALPEGYVRISSFVDFYSSQQTFQKPVNCQIFTWCTSNHIVNADVFCLDGNTWQKITTVPIGEEQKVRFEANHFSPYGLYVRIQKLFNLTFQVCNQFYYNRVGGFVHEVFLGDEAECQKRIQKWKDGGYKLAAFNNPNRCLLLAYGEQIHLVLRCLDSGQIVFDWNFRLDDNFLRYYSREKGCILQNGLEIENNTQLTFEYHEGGNDPFQSSIGYPLEINFTSKI